MHALKLNYVEAVLRQDAFDFVHDLRGGEIQNADRRGTNNAAHQVDAPVTCRAPDTHHFRIRQHFQALSPGTPHRPIHFAV